MQPPVQLGQVAGGCIRCRPLELGPDELIGVEFGGVTGKRVGMNAGVAPDELLDDCRPMSPAPVPEENDLPAKMA